MTTSPVAAPVAAPLPSTAAADVDVPVARVAQEADQVVPTATTTAPVAPSATDVEPPVASAAAAVVDASDGAAGIGGRIAAAQNSSLQTYANVHHTFAALTQNFSAVGQMAKGYWAMLRGG